MSGATVSAEPGPHWGLGIDGYVQWSSPIRRFNDLLVHWQSHYCEVIIYICVQILFLCVKRVALPTGHHSITTALACNYSDTYSTTVDAGHRCQQAVQHTHYAQTISKEVAARRRAAERHRHRKASSQSRGDTASWRPYQ
eukprot:2477-Heterococcus_DN1.PRE.1